jgi:FkbM family methyltransferase
MQETARRLIGDLGRRVLHGIRWRLADDHERRAMAWNAAGLNDTLRLDYDLSHASVVVDVGGYEGQWASDVYGRYTCRIEVFEPVEEFADNIGRRFARNPDIRVHHFGLAGSSRTVPMYLGGNRSSAVAAPAPDAVKTLIRLADAAETFRGLGLEVIDLIKINIEGGEYELLEHLIDTGWVTRITNIQVQFHDCLPDARARMRSLQDRLKATHEITYQEEFIWENWRLSGAP